MARTLKGNLTGKAGATEKAELREQLYEAEMKRLEKERERRRRAEVSREKRLMRACIELEGWEAFSKWWDDVPSYGIRSMRIGLLEERLKFLHERSLQKVVDDGAKSQ